MKKNRVRNIIIIGCILITLIQLSGGLRFFTIASSATEPNLKHKTHFIGSNFVFPKRLDFSYYQRVDDILNLGCVTIIQRLIAIPEDVLECKKGVFFVNGENIDDTINLRRLYKFHIKDYEKYIKSTANKDQTIITIPYRLDSIAVTLNEDFVSQLNIKSERYLPVNSPIDLPSDINVVKVKDEDWNANNFGPFKMPKNKYFFVGDNRGNSMDSRFFGFVEKKDIKGTLLFKF